MRAKARRVAFIGILLGVAAALGYIERLFPPVPFAPPSVKLGLSNVAVMYCVFFIGGGEAVALNCMKSFFVFLIAGPLAGVLSLCGGLLSVCATIIAARFLKSTYALISVIGAIAHNIGQYAAVSVIMETAAYVYYIPVLIISGVIMGFLTGALLRAAIPAFDRILRR